MFFLYTRIIVLIIIFKHISIKLSVFMANTGALALFHSFIQSYGHHSVLQGGAKIGARPVGKIRKKNNFHARIFYSLWGSFSSCGRCFSYVGFSRRGVFYEFAPSPPPPYKKYAAGAHHRPTPMYTPPVQPFDNNAICCLYFSTVT